MMMHVEKKEKKKKKSRDRDACISHCFKSKPKESCIDTEQGDVFS